MATKTAVLSFQGEGVHFSASSGSGHTIVLDDGAGDRGMRPSELVPIAVAGCTAMDVITILRKKRQAVERYEVRASGHQEDAAPNEFTRIDIVHVVEGPTIEVEAVRQGDRAVSHEVLLGGRDALERTGTTHHAYIVRDGQGDDRMAEVLVTGPNQDPHASRPNSGHAHHQHAATARSTTMIGPREP